MSENKTHPIMKKNIVNRKAVTISGIILIFALAGVIGGIVWYQEFREKREKILIYGTENGLLVLDPLLAHQYEHFESLNILENIAEPLFEFEFSSGGSRIVSNLAVYGDNWSPDGLNFTCSLKTLDG